MRNLIQAILMVIILVTATSAQVPEDSKKGTTVLFLDMGVRPGGGQLGYKGANPIGRGTVHHFLTDKFYIGGSAFLGQDKKIVTDDGYQFGGDVIVGLALEQLRELELEAGVQLAELRTSQFRKADLSVVLAGRFHLDKGAFLEVVYSNADRFGYVTEPLSELIGTTVNLNKTNSLKAGIIYRQPLGESFGFLGQVQGVLTRFRDDFDRAHAAVTPRASAGVYFRLK
jgi:hypothetical protein